MDESGNVESLARCFENLSLQVQTIEKCQRILNTLTFEEIHWRQDNIPEAHANTFDWIFRNSKLGFTDWAAAKDGMCKTTALVSGTVFCSYLDTVIY